MTNEWCIKQLQSGRVLIRGRFGATPDTKSILSAYSLVQSDSKTYLGYANYHPELPGRRLTVEILSPPCVWTGFPELEDWQRQWMLEGSQWERLRTFTANKQIIVDGPHGALPPADPRLLVIYGGFLEALRAHIDVAHYHLIAEERVVDALVPKLQALIEAQMSAWKTVVSIS